MLLASLDPIHVPMTNGMSTIQMISGHFNFLTAGRDYIFFY